MSTLTLDAEALYLELLAGVRALFRPGMRLVGVTSGGPAVSGDALCTEASETSSSCAQDGPECVPDNGVTSLGSQDSYSLSWKSDHELMSTFFKGGK